MYKQLELITPITDTIKPKSHPRHYLIHKYWGRKNYNVIRAYIEHFTTEGDTVLDPFMGSGATAISSIRTNRNYIGFELEEKYYLSSIKRIKGEK